MKTKHTSGPWVACKNHAWGKVADIRTESGDTIAFCQTLHEPDARLIAAAPEMLAALEHVKGEIGAWKNEPECNCEDCVMLRPVYAAIAKATGEDAP